MRIIGQVFELHNDPQRIKNRLIELMTGEAGLQRTISKLTAEQIEKVANSTQLSLLTLSEDLVTLTEAVFEWVKERTKERGDTLIVCAIIDWLVYLIEATPTLESITQLDAAYQLFFNTEMRNRIREAILEVVEDDGAVSEEQTGDPNSK